MSPNDILICNKEASDESRRAVWYFQARYIEDEGFDKVAEEIAREFAEPLNKVSVNRYRNCRFDVYQIKSALNTFCIGGGDVVPRVVCKVFQEFCALAGSKVARRFHRTNIGSQVWETLDWCREERRPCFIEGREGRGKSTAARAWYEAHQGEARYVTLSGTRSQRDFIVGIAKAYGINFGGKSPNEVRWRVKDVIIRSGLVLILDEAHQALPERHSAGRPPMIDWIDCDLCNHGVPVALISTPQFGPMLSQFEDKSKWNANQFRRRFSGRWACLPEKTRDADLEALAEQALPSVGDKGIELALGYAGTFGRDVSGLFDLVRDAERRARKAGHDEVTLQDLRDAYKLDRIPSENALANSFKRPINSRFGAGEDPTLPEAGEPSAAPLQRSRATESEFTAPDRAARGILNYTHD